MDRLTEMASFVVVADAGSFSAAAIELGVSAQIVGRRISQLEARLGGPLLVRNTRKSRLTDAGRLFYDRCRSVVDAVEAAERSVAEIAGGPPRGRMVISAPRTFGGLALAPLIADYLAAYPNVSIRLNLTDRYVDLVGEDVDVAIRIGNLPDSGLIVRRLRNYRLSPYAAPSYLESRGQPRTPADLAAHECIIFAYENGGLLDEWAFERNDITERVPVSGRFVTEDGRAMIEMAAAGHGILLQDERLVEPFLKAGRLVSVLADWQGPARQLNLVYASTASMRPALRSLMDAIVGHFRARDD